MEIRKMHLTDKDIEKLDKCELGHGTDGIVFKTKQGIIKIYHTSFNKITSALSIKDDSDVKIYIPNMPKKSASQINDYGLTYYQGNGEHIRIRNIFAIEEAIKRQKYVTRTNLPQGLVYYYNLFVGCILKDTKGIQIHRLTGLPIKIKRRIMKSILLDVEELLSNNIYHTDLNNSPFSESSNLKGENRIESVGHSHVLVNPITAKTSLIDLEGKTTIYTDRKDDYYEDLSLRSLIDLILEFFIGIDLNNYKDGEELDLDYLDYELTNLGITEKYVKGLVNRSLNMEQIQDFIDSTTKIRTL